MDLLLPGFRFHPTEQELVGFYLKRMVEGKRIACDFIPRIDLYCYDPWELKGMAMSSEKEWYFFVPRDRKGGRPSRLTKCGYWKATGIDKIVQSTPNHTMPHHCYGLRKTLVYYKGRAPKGIKTEWIMNEYRLIYNSDCNVNHPSMDNLESTITLCKVYRKSIPLSLLQARQFGNSTANEGPDIMKPCSIKLEECNNLYSTDDHDIAKLPPFSQKSCRHAQYGLQALLNHKQEEATLTLRDPPIPPSSSIAIAADNTNHPDYQQQQHISIQPIIHNTLQSELARAADDDDDGAVEIDLWSYYENLKP